MKQEKMMPRTVLLGVGASAWAQGLTSAGTQCADPRRLILQGVPAALALCLVSAVVQGVKQRFTGKGLYARLIGAVFMGWFGLELLGTVWMAQRICWQQFGSLAVWGLLPFLLWAGFRLPGTVLDRSAAVLWGLAAVGGLLCLAGLHGQPDWTRLFALSDIREAAKWPIYPEYFSLSLLCAPDKQKKAVLLPMGVTAIQIAHGLLIALLFGGSELTAAQAGQEILRAAALGGVSRFDSLFLMIWLAAALFRVCFLANVLQSLWSRICGRMEAAGEGETR